MTALNITYVKSFYGLINLVARLQYGLQFANVIKVGELERSFVISGTT